MPDKAEITAAVLKALVSDFHGMTRNKLVGVIGVDLGVVIDGTKDLQRLLPKMRGDGLITSWAWRPLAPSPEPCCARFISGRPRVLGPAPSAARPGPSSPHTARFSFWPAPTARHARRQAQAPGSGLRCRRRTEVCPAPSTQGLWRIEPPESNTWSNP